MHYTIIPYTFGERIMDLIYVIRRMMIIRFPYDPTITYDGIIRSPIV